MLFSVIYTCFAFKIYTLLNHAFFLFLNVCLFEHESTFISIASECYIQYNKFILTYILHLLISIYSVMHIMYFENLY